MCIFLRRGVVSTLPNTKPTPSRLSAAAYSIYSFDLYNTLFNECLIYSRISSRVNFNNIFVVLTLGRETKTLQACKTGHPNSGAAKVGNSVGVYVMLTSK
jgi:hypothetical protein